MSRAVQEMFSRISPRYDLTNDLLSLGIHRLWRTRVRKLANPASGENIIDICTGTGDLALELAKTPGVAVTGVDFVPPMLEIAKEKAASRVDPRSTVRFIEADALHLPVADRTFEIATISFGIRNVDSPLRGLQEIFRVLKPGGRALILEFGQPVLPVIAPLYRLYSSKIMPILGSILTGDGDAYRYLSATSAKFPSRESFLQLMRDAGFQNCSFTTLSFGIAYLYRAEK